VVEKLNLREEGIARDYLQIRGAWEDHVRYGITATEWEARKPELTERFLTRSPV
jgi:RimJ/RimL family protein N-acetyltransferase